MSPAGLYAQFSVRSQGAYLYARGVGVKRFGLTPKYGLVERFRRTTPSATDPAGNYQPDKEKSTEKIDGVVATIMGPTARLNAAADPTLRACMTEEAYFSCNVNLRVTSGETL